MADVTTAVAADTHPDEVPGSGGARRQPRRTLGVMGRISAGWLLLLVVVALVAPLLLSSPDGSSRTAPNCGDGSWLPLYQVYDPTNCRDFAASRAQTQGLGARGEVRHLTGVDNAGHDTFSQVLVGTRTTLLIAGLSIGIATLLGGALGVAAGFYRGKVDTVITTLFDVMISFPPLILAMLLVLNVAAGDPERKVPAIIIALAVVATPILGRIARASTLTWSEREFVTAARALGARRGRIMWREVVPNVAPAMMSIALLGVGIVIVTESTLSLLGLGVPETALSWGYVLQKGAADLTHYPHLVFVPGVAIVVTVSALNFLGDALRRKFDVKESAL